MTDTAIGSDKDVESPDKDVESPISKDGSEESRNKLKDLDKKTVKFAGYMFWAILFIAAVATTSVLLNRPKEPNPNPESTSKISNPSKEAVRLDPGEYMISLNERFIFKHDEKSKHWVVKDYPDEAVIYWDLNDVLRLGDVEHGTFFMRYSGNLVLRSPNDDRLWQSDTRCTGIQLELEKGGNLVFKAIKCDKPGGDQPEDDIFWEANYRDQQDTCRGTCGTSLPPPAPTTAPTEAPVQPCWPDGKQCLPGKSCNRKRCCNGSWQQSWKDGRAVYRTCK